MNSISGWLLAALFLLSAVPATAAEWESYPGFFGPGHAGIAIGDYDGDGKSEAAVTGYTQFSFDFDGTQLLAVLSADEAGRLRINAITALPAELTGPLVTAPPQQGADRLIAVTSDGLFSRIVLLGDVPMRILRSIEAPLVRRVTDVADVDADGLLDILAVSNAGLEEGYPVVLDYETGAIKWTGSNLVSDIGVAELDGDAAGELIMAGTPGRIVDGITHVVEWSYPSGFPGTILTGRFHADPNVRGFALAIQWSGIQLFRSQPYSPVSEFAQFEIGAASTARLNPGGPDQIAVGEGQWGNVSVWDPRSGQPITSIPNPEHGVSAIAAGDIDADGHAELVYGAGLSSTGVDLLRVVDLETQTDDFAQYDEIGPHSTLARGDISGAGTDEVAFLTRGSTLNYTGANLRILDAVTGQELRKRLSSLERPWANTQPQIAIEQMDFDPQKELIISGAYDYHGGVVAVLDGLSLEDQWRLADSVIPRPISEPVLAMATIDANLDGATDIIIATSTVRLMALDGRDGATLWESVTFSGGTQPAIAAFHDTTGSPNVLLSLGTGIYVFDLQTHILASTIKTSSEITELWQWGDQAGCRFATLDEHSMVTVYRCPGMELAGSYPVPPNTTFFRPIYTDAPRFLVASGSRLYVSEADGTAFPVSGNLGEQIGAGNRGILRPGNDNEHFDLVIGSNYMVARMTVSALDVVFADDFD